MKVCPKCNGINNDKAKFCHYCGIKLYQNLTTRCPNCGRLCSLDKVYCPNCKAKLPIKSKGQRLTTFYPKSWLGNKKLLIKFEISLLVIVSVFCVVASLKSSTYIYHSSASRKVQINYQNGKYKTLFSEYYDIQPTNSNYANYFGGKESFWQKNRSFRSFAYFYGKNQEGYNRLWKENSGNPLVKYIMIQHAKTNQNCLEIRSKVSIKLISNQKDPMKFIDEYRDSGKCIYPGKPQVQYYQLNTLLQY